MRRIFDKNRANYKRKYKDGSCVFCGKKEVLECEGLAGKHWRVIINRYPYMNGNVMLVPVRHVEETDDLKDAEWREFSRILLRTKTILSKIFKTDSFNIGINIGPESGATISHLHWQIIPRFRDNYSVTSVLGELYPVTVSPEETKKLIDDFLANNQD